MLQEIIVGQARRSDFVARYVELIDEVHRSLVPAGGKLMNPALFAVAINLLIRGEVKFQTAFQVPIGWSEWVLTRFRQLFGGVDHFHSPLLELYRIASGGVGDIDQLLCQIDISVMVDADFG